MTVFLYPFLTPPKKLYTCILKIGIGRSWKIINKRSRRRLCLSTAQKRVTRSRIIILTLNQWCRVTRKRLFRVGAWRIQSGCSMYAMCPDNFFRTGCGVWGIILFGRGGGKGSEAFLGNSTMWFNKFDFSRRWYGVRTDPPPVSRSANVYAMSIIWSVLVCSLHCFKI